MKPPPIRQRLPTDETPAPTENNGDVVTVKWVAVGNGMPANYDAWKANLDKYLEEKIGVHLEMEIVSWSDWDNRRNVMVNANDDYDIMFTNLNTYQNDIRIGAFLDITDMVQSAAPSLYSTLPTELWDGVRVGGQIYGVPTWKDSSVTQYFVWDKAVAEQYVPNYADLKELADLTDGLTAIKDATNTAPFILNMQGLDAIFGAKFDGLTAGLPTLGVRYDDNSRKVVCTVEQEDIMNELKTLRSWYEAGIINADAATLGENPKYRPCYVAQGWSLARRYHLGPQHGRRGCCCAVGSHCDVQRHHPGFHQLHLLQQQEPLRRLCSCWSWSTPTPMSVTLCSTAWKAMTSSTPPTASCTD